MNNLRKYNNYVLNRCYSFITEQDLATPLLVSSNENYIHNLKRKVLYIGQETNGWLNYSDKYFKPEVEEVEAGYLDFLSRRGGTNKDFWTFIRNCLDINREELSSNIIWGNTIISSKRQGIGNPEVTEELEKISVDYLLYLYEFFKPDYTIFANGPHNPYYTITTKFLKNIKSELVDKWPTKQEPVLIDEKKDLFWTYHPNYLNRSHLKNDVTIKIKTLIKK